MLVQIWPHFAHIHDQTSSTVSLERVPKLPHFLFTLKSSTNWFLLLISWEIFQATFQGPPWRANPCCQIQWECLFVCLFFLISLDFSEAFNKVDHSMLKILFSCLNLSDITGQTPISTASSHFPWLTYALPLICPRGSNLTTSVFVVLHYLTPVCSCNHIHTIFALSHVILVTLVLILRICLCAGLPWWLSSKESACSVGVTGDMSSIPGSGGSLGEGHGNQLQYSCLENPHGQRSLSGYTPQSHKETQLK